MELNHYIPAPWRLSQQLDDGEVEVDFPVFVKPDWGQNSNGVEPTKDYEELCSIRRKRGETSVAFLLQEAAKEENEFEIFYLRDAGNPEKAAILSVTETVNSTTELHPVNGVHNRDSSYHDRTNLFSETELQSLWNMVKSIGYFRIARVGLRANSVEELMAGNFHVIEVNIFLPMPLVLLDKQLGWSEKHRFIKESMRGAVKLAARRFRSKK